MTQRRFDAVVFDMDGVLVDSEPMQRDATRRLLAGYGVDFHETDEFFGCTDLDMFAVLVPRHGLPHDPATLTALRAALVVRLVGEGLTSMPGIPAVPREMRERGYRLAVASSSAPDVIRAVVAALDLATLFETVVSGHEVPRGKPAPDVFLEAARRLGARPARCLVVEDSRNGVLAAKAAGMACAAVPCADTRHQDFSEADWRLETLAELPALLTADRRLR